MAVRVRQLPRNIWVVSLTSFLTDISSEMVLNLIPLFLANVLGMGGTVIGAVEGIAESLASLLRIFSGYLSDRLRRRKWLAVLGYGISALAKPLFYFAGSWWQVALARWADRVGKGVRTAPRDALVADSIDARNRGLAFGLHRAADTAGAFLGIVGALLAVHSTQGATPALQGTTFRTIVLVSLVPAFLAVLALAGLAREPAKSGWSARVQPRFSGLGRSFLLFLALVGLFELGNSADAFLVLRAQTLGASVLGILGMLAVFNLGYSLTSAPAGGLSDRVPRKVLIVGGWVFYALVYFGVGLAREGWHMWILYGAYGLYYGVAYGTARALVADIVPAELRGTAYGAYATVVGLMAFPASLLAGLLWDLFGPPAPFFCGGSLGLLAALGLALWNLKPSHSL